jgi:DNA-directed RNA polymerase specialized sigma24 family protein
MTPNSTEASQTVHRSMSGRHDELATVELAYVDGYTVHEIAQLLNVPADQVAIRLHDGLRGFLRAQRKGGPS